MATKTATANQNTSVQNLTTSDIYEWRRSDGGWVSFLTAQDSGSSFNIPNNIG